MANSKPYPYWFEYILNLHFDICCVKPVLFLEGLVGTGEYSAMLQRMVSDICSLAQLSM